jgi:hypothetical protein
MCNIIYNSEKQTYVFISKHATARTSTARRSVAFPARERSPWQTQDHQTTTTTTPSNPLNNKNNPLFCIPCFLCVLFVTFCGEQVSRELRYSRMQRAQQGPGERQRDRVVRVQEGGAAGRGGRGDERAAGGGAGERSRHEETSTKRRGRGRSQIPDEQGVTQIDGHLQRGASEGGGGQRGGERGHALLAQLQGARDDAERAAQHGEGGERGRAAAEQREGPASEGQQSRAHGKGQRRVGREVGEGKIAGHEQQGGRTFKDEADRGGEREGAGHAAQRRRRVTLGESREHGGGERRRSMRLEVDGIVKNGRAAIRLVEERGAVAQEKTEKASEVGSSGERSNGVTENKIVGEPAGVGVAGSGRGEEISALGERAGEHEREGGQADLVPGVGGGAREKGGQRGAELVHGGAKGLCGRGHVVGDGRGQHGGQQLGEGRVEARVGHAGDGESGGGEPGLGGRDGAQREAAELEQQRGQHLQQVVLGHGAGPAVHLGHLEERAQRAGTHLLAMVARARRQQTQQRAPAAHQLLRGNVMSNRPHERGNRQSSRTVGSLSGKGQQHVSAQHVKQRRLHRRKPLFHNKLNKTKRLLFRGFKKRKQTNSVSLFFLPVRPRLACRRWRRCRGR